MATNFPWQGSSRIGYGISEVTKIIIRTCIPKETGKKQSHRNKKVTEIKRQSRERTS